MEQLHNYRTKTQILIYSHSLFVTLANGYNLKIPYNLKQVNSLFTGEKDYK